MGFGDDMMITAIAKSEKKKFPEKQIIIGDFNKKTSYHSILYNNNPNITNPKKIDKLKSVHFIDYHPFNRPYIDYEKSNKDNWCWNFDFKPTPGEIFFTEKEIDNSNIIIKNAIDYWTKNNDKNYKAIIFIEPSSSKIHNKQFYFKHKNKDWSFHNWIKLVNFLFKDYLIIQSIHKESTKFENVYYCDTDFRTACSVMNKSNLYVGLEGGFGHVAAALNKKAVIYFGGWIHPQVTGYDIHKNIYVNINESPCGSMSYECKHCQDCREKISVNYFYNSILDYLNI